MTDQEIEQIRERLAQVVENEDDPLVLKAFIWATADYILEHTDNRKTAMRFARIVSKQVVESVRIFWQTEDTPDQQEVLH